MRTLLTAMALAAGLACAALNTASMTPACRDRYNACLDGCPRAPSVDERSTGMDHGPYIETAQCTDGCNREAKGCH